MTALPTLCLRSHMISLRRSCAVLGDGDVHRRDNERMHASTLSFATSIPTTTRLLCAIIQLPSLLGPGSKPMQLFGLRKTPDLSLAPRQALAALGTKRAQIQRRAAGESRPFAHSGKFCGHKSTKYAVKTIAQGMPGDFRRDRGDYTRVHYQHTAHEAAGAPGARHSLRPLISES